MTINIGLVTSDAIVFGCDSIASVTTPFLNPFSGGLQTTKDGKPKIDKNGRFTVKFEFDEIQEIVTDAWGGVTKMFQIHDMPAPVVAVTAGLAKLRERSVASFGEEFREKCRTGSPQLDKVEDIAKAFLAFMKGHYDKHYQKSPLPAQFKEGPIFLIGGFGKDDDFASLYRISVQHNGIRTEFSPGKSGVSWNGQADAVERFIRGYDGPLKDDIESRIVAELRKYHDQITVRSAEIINNVLSSLNAEMPDGIDISLPDPDKVKLPWGKYRTTIPYGNLPLQEAINSVSFLVNLQAGKSRFARGVATVGGRVHIGVVTKNKGFELLNEPELVHRYTGFGDDL